MTLTNAEKVRRYRERQKAAKRGELRKVGPAVAVFQRPFFEYLSEVDFGFSSDFNSAFDLAGIPTPQFDDDRGPEAYTLDEGLPAPGEDFYPFDGATGSLGRAEVIVGCMIDAAVDLAYALNHYKKSEIQKRIAEMESSDLTDPEAKRVAFAKMGEMNAMLEELKREIRWPFPIWKTGMKSMS